MTAHLTPAPAGEGIAAGDPLAGDEAVADEPKRAAEPDREKRSSDRFRTDIAGLRAVAVGLVLLYHAGLPFVPAGFVGVDIFFVISGYLITGQLVAEIERTGRISLVGFYARRAKRILPAAGVVLAVTAAASWLWLPRLHWREVGGDIVGAATYIVNWRLADRAVDYLAQDSTPSPVQHYWSLAVEEQFYLVWPVLILGALVAARALGRVNVRPALWLGLAAIALPSLTWSIIETANSPDRAFFLSTTRLWELSIGAGVALAAAQSRRIPQRVGIPIGWLGLTAIVASALIYSSRTAWPGFAAALPTLGAAAVIVAGAAAGPRGPVMVLGTRAFQWVGELSYSLYLWHWPLLIIAAAYWGDLSVISGLAVVIAAVVPSWITFRLVENPLRYSRAVSGSPRLALSIGANFTLVGACAGLSLVLLAQLAVPASNPSAREAPGAAVLVTPPGIQPDAPVRNRFKFIVPDPVDAGTDLPDTTPDDCFQQMVLPDLIWCEYGVPDGRTTVALVGDSKADQWLPAFQELATQNDWKLVVAFKGACPLTAAVALTGDDPNDPYPDCTEWNTALLSRLVEERPEYVFTSQTSGKAADGAGGASVDSMVDGMRDAWGRLAEVGSKVVVIANNPYPGLDVPACVDANRKRLSACGYSPDVRHNDAGYLTQRKAVAGTDVPMIDLFDTICPTTACPPVIGNVLVYRRGSHLTATFVRSMSQQLAKAMRQAGVTVTYSPTG